MKASHTTDWPLPFTPLTEALMADYTVTGRYETPDGVEKTQEETADVSRDRDISAIMKIRAILREVPASNRAAVLQFLMSTEACHLNAYLDQKRALGRLGVLGR